MAGDSQSPEANSSYQKNQTEKVQACKQHEAHLTQNRYYSVYK